MAARRRGWYKGLWFEFISLHKLKSQALCKIKTMDAIYTLCITKFAVSVHFTLHIYSLQNSLFKCASRTSYTCANCAPSHAMHIYPDKHRIIFVINMTLRNKPSVSISSYKILQRAILCSLPIKISLLVLGCADCCLPNRLTNQWETPAGVGSSQH